MTSKSQDNQSGYVDGVRVKISERYKPPPRINLAMSYAQRLTLNKHIEDNIQSYDFILEKTVKDKMNEWRLVRKSLNEEQKARLEQARIEEDKRLEQLDNNNDDDSNENELNKDLNNLTITNQNYQNLQDILMPIQVTSTDHYSTILKPIQLTEYNRTLPNSNIDKSPFNISDFEADTSSPFDNMELKSINDMEELALVLKKDPVGPNFNNTNIPQQNYIYPNYSYIPNNISYMTPTSTYSQTNGYYYPSTFNNPTNYPHYTTASSSTSTLVNQMDKDLNISKINSSDRVTINNKVPDILKSLNDQLNTLHLDNKTTNLKRNNEPVKSDNIDNINDTDENPFDQLPKKLQDCCTSISAMGFPLSRVARVCKIIGNDQKKIVEHLLAMSELLVLGFPENNVSEALIQCNNDTDKALDLLITL